MSTSAAPSGLAHHGILSERRRVPSVALSSRFGRSVFLQRDSRKRSVRNLGASSHRAREPSLPRLRNRHVIPASIRLDAKRDRGRGNRVRVAALRDGNGNDRWIDLGHSTTSQTEAGHIGAMRSDRVTREAAPRHRRLPLPAGLSRDVKRGDRACSVTTLWRYGVRRRGLPVRGEDETRLHRSTAHISRSR